MRRLLDPIDRSSEILFGLIMVLTFTGSFSAAHAGRHDVDVMLAGALGCNLAWGIVDAVMFLMSARFEQGRGLRTLHGVRGAGDAAEAQRIIREALPPIVASALSPAQLERVRRALLAMPEPPRRPRLGRDDWLGALGVFILVTCSTFPVAAPFLFLDDAALALRLSNGVAIVMLFLIGWEVGRYSGGRPWRVGLAMVLAGLALVGVTIALGG